MQKLLLTLLCSYLLLSCSTNPVTGESNFVLMTEKQEIKMGRNYHPQVLKQFGAYNNPELQTYINDIGQALAKQSHRSDLDFTFTLLDSADINAFAAPGGYIYITRGLLAYLNTENQLAAVLGHEIGHVTARHSVRQVSIQQASNFGYNIASILVPEVGGQVGQALYGVLGGSLISGYGRDQELEADRLGAEYLATTQRDAHAMIEVIGVLKNQELFDIQLAKEEGRKPRSYHGLFSSHPDNDTRLQEVIDAADSLFLDPLPQKPAKEFIAKLDGLTFGDSEKNGIRRGHAFYHKDLNFSFTFPVGWSIINSAKTLIGQNPQHTAIIQVKVEKPPKNLNPYQRLVKDMSASSIVTLSEPIHQFGITGHTGVIRTSHSGAAPSFRRAVLYHQGQAFIIDAGTKKGVDFSAFDDSFLAAIKSFHPLTEIEKPLAMAMKLSTIKTLPGQKLQELAQLSALPHHAEDQLRLLNQLYPTGEPATGQLLKIID